MEELAQQTPGASGKTLVVSLSDDEFDELRRAIGEANLPNLSLLVFQAIQAGLESDEAQWIQRKRTRTVNIHVSRKFWEKIRLKARMSCVTQQALIMVWYRSLDDVMNTQLKITRSDFRRTATNISTR